MTKRTRDDILRERDRLAPAIERAFGLTEDQLVAIEAEAAKGKGGAARQRLVQATDVSDLFNPLTPTTDFQRENPHYHLLSVLRDPEYFPLTCKMLYGIDIDPFQHVILKILWTKPMPLLVGARGVGKTFITALYCHLRLLFHQGCQIAIVGAAFRQSKFVFDYMERIWAEAPILRDLLGGGKGRNDRNQGPRRDVDRCEFIIGQSKASALPIGPDGSKIRGERANYVIGEEFASLSEEVFNNVVFGFASVSGNPVQSAWADKRKRVMKAMGLWDEADETAARKATRHNQVVVSGTADYAFGHFAKTYRMYRSIAYSGGDPKKLVSVFPDGIPEGFDHRDYACVRLPAKLLPPRYMDEKIVGAARAKLSKAQFLREYDATFPQDSEGYFKRSLVESCVVGRPSAPVLLAGEEVIFYPSMRGEPGVQHVIAVDPASERDKLAIVVLAMRDGHRRVVHVWTTDRKSHVARKELQQGVEGDYFRFAASKIRALMGRFPTARLAIDGQGGGIPIMEALANPTDPNESAIYLLKDPPGTTDRKPTDHKPGLHIIEVVQFASAAWTAEANTSLKADFEQQKLLLPMWDTASEELALADDKRTGRVKIEDNREVQTGDSLLDVVNDIEELKDELTSIMHTRLPSGRDRWDVPEIKLEGGKKGRLRKDRYSALLMANASARALMNADPDTPYESFGAVKGGTRRPGDEPQPFYKKKPGWVPDTHGTGRSVSRR